MGIEYDYPDKIARGCQLKEELETAGFLVETIYSGYNLADPPASKPGCTVVLDDSETKDPTAIVDAHVPGLTPEEIHQQELDQEANDKSHAGLTAFNNWSSLTSNQKDAVLKNVLWHILYKEGLL